MKLMKKFILGLIVILSTFLGATVKADSAPDSFIINASNIKMLYGANYLGNGSTLNFTYKTTADGKVVYCTEIHDTMTSSSEKYTLSKEMDARYAYVLANGYPNKSITGNNEKDYYITGLALWYLVSPTDSVFTYIDLNAGTYKGVSSDIIKEVAKLVNGAKSYTYTVPSINIQNATSNFTLSSDKTYYVSNTMSVSTTGGIGTYFLSLTDAPSGTVITDLNGKVLTGSNGEAKTGLNVNESFLVKVPVSSIKTLSMNFKINVSGTGTINTAYLYAPTVSAHQSLVTLYPQNKTVADHKDLGLTLHTKTEISKQDATTGKELPGATLELTKPDGSKITWESKNEPHVITDLLPGKYILKETHQPKGYKLSTETITFEIKADGTVVKQVMKNYPEDKIYISKQDATTGKELPDAKLVLKDSKSNIVDKWTSGNTPHLVEGLKAGKYYLTETDAPEGYIKSEETVEFIVDKNGKVEKPVIMKNYPEGTVEISKQDGTTGKELPGATIELTRPDGTKETWISGTEPHMVTNLTPGKYTLKETIQPKGYKLSEETVTFTVDKYGKVKEKVVMKNYPEKTVLISKQDITTGKELYGATLEVRDELGNLIESWTSGKEPHPITNLDPGKYTLTETYAPDGYKLSKETVEFVVNEDGEVDGMVIMYNEPYAPVVVPKTSSFKTITTSLIGLMIIGLGAAIIVRNYKKNEE